MMFDGKGCGVALAGASIVGLVIGLLIVWLFGAPWYVPLIGLLSPAIAAAVVLLACLIGWMRDGSH